MGPLGDKDSGFLLNVQYAFDGSFLKFVLERSGLRGIGGFSGREGMKIPKGVGKIGDSQRVEMWMLLRF